MRSSRAILWALWRRGRLHFALMGSGLILFSALILSIAPQTGEGMLWICTICLSIHILHLAEERQGAGLGRFLMTLPMSNRTLAWSHLLPLAGVLVLSYAAGSTALRMLLGVETPLLAPALLLATLFCWMVVALWFTVERPTTRTCAMAAPFAIGYLALRLRFGSTAMTDPRSTLEAVGLPDLAVVGLLLMTAFGVAPFAIGRHRRAAGQRDRNRSRHLGSLAAPFESPMRALFWAEWREKGRLLPVFFGLPWLVLALGRWAGVIDNPELLTFARAQVHFGLLFGPVLVTGIVCRVQGGEIVAGLPMLSCLRPVPSRTLAANLIKVSLVSLLIVWLLTITGAAMTWFATRASPLTAALVEVLGRFTETGDWQRVGLLLVGVLVVGWLQIGWIAAMLLTGRNSIALLLVLCPYALGIALLVFARDASNLPIEGLMTHGPWALGALGIAISIALLTVALERRLVPGPWIATLGAVWGLLILVPWFTGVSLSLPLWMLWTGIAGLVATPWIGCTLAVAWNRHR